MTTERHGVLPGEGDRRFFHASHLPGCHGSTLPSLWENASVPLSWDEDSRRLGLSYNDPRRLPESACSCLDIFARSAFKRASSIGE
jgi:hypothetical protein